MNAYHNSIGLGIFRIITCLLIIKNMCFYLPMSDDLFGIYGIFPYSSYLQILESNHLMFLAYPFHLLKASQLYIAITIILSSMYMLGYGGRITGLFLLILVFILKFRNGFILDGSDNVMQVTLPFLVVSDSHFFFRYREKRTISDQNKSSLVNFISLEIKNVALLALMIQICFIYFFTSLAKLQGSMWLNGTATYYTMRVQEFMATKWNIPLTQNHYFVVFTTYFTILYEMAFPFLIWFRKTKFWIMLFGVFLHIGIWVFMRIDNFSWIMIGTYFVFINDSEYRNYLNIFQSKIDVFIDSWCPNCQRFGRIVQTLDVLNLITVNDIRASKVVEDYPTIDKDRSLKEMVSINNNKVMYGFDSLFYIVLRIPSFWIALPLFFLLKISGLGNILYRELAIKRKIIPLHCTEDTCEISI